MTGATADLYATATEEEREAAIDAAARTIQLGRLVVFPTDTVYGIAADAFDPDAVSRLLKAKSRGREMPPPVLVSTQSTINALATDIPDYVHALVDAHWPGALTVVCRQQSSLRWDLGETRGTVAVRMPDHDLAREIIERTGPLAVSSANLSGLPAAMNADHAVRMLGEKVSVIVDGGATPALTPSTILDCTGERPRLLRIGKITVADLDDTLADFGVTVQTDTDEKTSESEPEPAAAEPDAGEADAAPDAGAADSIEPAAEVRDVAPDAGGSEADAGDAERA